jgi:hypothetical protein
LLRLPLIYKTQVLPILTITPSLSPVPTETATPVDVCEDLITNGDFASGGDGWHVPATEYPARHVSTSAFGGDYAMQLGIVDPRGNVRSYSDVQQTVTIPGGARRATLRFWLYAMSAEPRPVPTPMPRPRLHSSRGGYPPHDSQYVLVLDERDRWIDTILWHCADDRVWVPYAFDLGPYAGRTLRLQFGVYNDGLGGVTAVYLDEVSVTVCSLE